MYQADNPSFSLHFVGIWGSAFTILLQRMLGEGQAPSAIRKFRRSSSSMREDLRMYLLCYNCG